MRCWLFAAFDPLPSQNPMRYSFLVRYLAEQGGEAVWWTSKYAHFLKRYYTREEVERENQALPANAKIVATWAPAYRRHVGIARLIHHIVWGLTTTWSAAFTTPRPDVILVSTTPLLAARMIQILGRILGVPVIIDVIDLWPEAFEIIIPRRLTPLTRPVFSLLRALENRIFKKAEAVIAVTNTYLQVALSRGGDKPCLFAPYGSRLPANPETSEPESPVIRICYSGSIGPQHDIDTILETAKRMQTDPHVVFFLVGGGETRSLFEQKAHEMGLTNLHFLPWMCLDDLLRFQQTCHIGLLAVAHESVITIPLKTFDYLAAGLALVHSLQGELKEFIAKEGIGQYYRGGDAASLHAVLRDLIDHPETIQKMGTRAREIAETQMNRERVHELILQFMSRVSGVGLVPPLPGTDKTPGATTFPASIV